MTKFKGILDNATRADSIVKDKYQSNREAMVLLGIPEEEIVSAIPVGGAQAASASGSQVGVCVVRARARARARAIDLVCPLRVPSS